MSDRQEYKKAWYLKNIDRIRAVHAAWRSENKEHRRNYNKAWRDRNRGKAAAPRNSRGGGCEKSRRRAYYLENRDKIIARVKAYNAKNPEVNLKSSRKWRASNPEKAYIVALNNRVRRNYLMASGRVSKAEWDEIKSRYSNRCAYCRLARKLAMDHDMPLSRGGAHSAANILPACKSCNSKKGTKTAIEFMGLTFRHAPATIPS